MSKDDIMDLCQKSYNKGYLEGYQDGASQMKNSTKEFSDRIYENLIFAVKESVKNLPFEDKECAK